jgi:anti-anti-sigma factor
MKIDQHKVGTVDVITPVGPLAEDDSEKFRALLCERIKQSGARLALAMHEVPYMDSVALEGLLDASEMLTERAMTLKLAGVTPTCREILELTGLSTRLRFFNDVQDVVKSFL